MRAKYDVMSTRHASLDWAIDAAKAIASQYDGMHFFLFAVGKYLSTAQTSIFFWANKLLR